LVAAVFLRAAPFYGAKNQEKLSRRIADIEAGRNIAARELIETEND